MPEAYDGKLQEILAVEGDVRDSALQLAERIGELQQLF
jgi:hypothetical protein